METIEKYKQILKSESIDSTLRKSIQKKIDILEKNKEVTK